MAEKRNLKRCEVRGQFVSVGAGTAKYMAVSTGLKQLALCGKNNLMTKLLVLAVVLAVSSAGPASALELKVDIGNTGYPKTGWIAWDHDSGGYGWDDIPWEQHDVRTLSAAYTRGTGIEFDIDGFRDSNDMSGGKAGVELRSSGEDLSIDFFWCNYNADEIRLTIRNAPAGSYELFTYHNDPEVAHGNIPSIQISGDSVVAKQEAANVPQQSVVLDDNIVPSRVSFATDGSGPVTIVYGGMDAIIINGFVLSFGQLYVDVNAPGPTHNGQSWPSAFLHVQDALTAANPYDHILVADGTYYPDRDAFSPTGSRQRTATFQLINGVALSGGYAGYGAADPNARDVQLYETILSGDLDGNDVPGLDPCDLPYHTNRGENSYHVVTGSGTDATVVLDGFTITAGNANAGSLPNDSGGGIFNIHGSPTVSNCKFIDNCSGLNGDGGAMYNDDSSPTVTDCIFAGNYTRKGGGMYNDWHCDPTVTNCTFSGNWADDRGGGMFNAESDPNVSGCTFTGNWGHYGGGMCSRDLSSPIITNCTFIGNLANYGGGIWDKNGSSTTVINSRFIDNWSANDAGGIMGNQCNTTAINCTLSGNSGPALAFFNYSPTSTVILTNCTFQGHSRTLACDSNDQSYPSNVQITNCILWNGGDEISNNDGSTITINYSDVQGGWGGPGSNNIDADPCFVDANGPDGIIGTEDDNLRLLVDSNCIDAGDNTAVPADIADLDGDGNTTEPTPYDLDGHLRFVNEPSVANTGNGTGPLVDMGAYERGVCGNVDHPYPPGDLNEDCAVDFHDIAVIGNYWLVCNKPDCD